MLISTAEATRRYLATGQAISLALQAGQLTRHEAANGTIRLDTNQLDQLFDAVEQPQTEHAEPPPTQTPSAKHDRRLPTPDELDAAVARALGL